jgi:mono/diheme cytochrome c family protein
MSTARDPAAVPPVPPDPDAQETPEMGALHEQVMREHAEPRDGLEPIPPFLTVFFGFLFFIAGFYMALNSAGFKAGVFDDCKITYTQAGPDTKTPYLLPSLVTELFLGGVKGGGEGEVKKSPPPELSPRELGKRVFQNCVACHQAHGNGVPGQYPPLAGSEWVLEKPKSALIRILLLGLQGPVTVKGQTFNGQMPAWGYGAQNLGDKKIAAVLTYIRSEWGNGGPEVTEADVAAVRKAVLDDQKRRTPWTEAELQAVTQDDPPLGGAAAAAATPPAKK